MSRKQRAGRLCRALAQPAVPAFCCEPLEPRMLLNAIPADGVIGNTVTIKGTAGNDVITISAHTGRLGFQFVDWTLNGGPTQSAQVLPTESILVDTGTGEDEVIVQKTPGVPIFIQGDSPTDDILNLGGPNGLQGIFGSITVITNQAAFWDITADDSADTTSRTGTLSASSATGPLIGSLSGLAPGVINWDVSKCHGLAIDTSKGGGNTLNVLQTNVTTTISGNSAGADDSVTIGNPTDGLADIAAAVTIARPTQTAGLTNLTLDDQANPNYEGYILDDGSLSVGGHVNFASYTSKIGWISSALRSVTVKAEAPVAGQGAGGVYVVNTNVATTVAGDSPGFFVDISESPEGHTLQGILGSVYVTNLAGSTHLTVRGPTGNTAQQTVLLHTITLPGDSGTYGAIEGLWPVTIAYKDADTAGVSFTVGGNAADTVHVAATGTNVLVSSPIVSVGDAGSLQNIAGTLSIMAGSVTVDDSADPISRNATISIVKPDLMNQIPWAAIGGLSPASIQAFPLTPNLVINGGTGANAYTINAPPLTLPPGSLMPHVGIVLNTGSGKDTVQVLASGLGKPLTIDGQGGNDAFTVNYGASITDNLVFNGGNGSDTLTLIGPAADAKFNLTSGTITFGTFTTTYTAVKTLALATGTFTVTGDLNGVNLSTSGFTTAKFQTSAHLGLFNIGGGTGVILAVGATPLSNTLFCTSLSIDAAGKLDLANNALQLSYSGTDPISNIRSYLASGYNNGTWNGSGIITSAGDATHALGFGDSADGTVSDLAPNTLLVRWTRYGDVNLDGKVGFADLVAVARNYGKSGRNWDQGDMNYDGTVDFGDLVSVARNYGAAAAVRAASAMLVGAPLEMPIKTRKRP